MIVFVSFRFIIISGEKVFKEQGESEVLNVGEEPGYKKCVSVE